VLPGQGAGLLGQVLAFLAEAILAGVEGVVEGTEQAGLEDVRDDQPAQDVEEVFLALGQAVHVAEPMQRGRRRSNELAHCCRGTRAGRMGVVSIWEYAEVAWHPIGKYSAYWCGPDGPKTLKVHGVEALNEAVRDGWEVAEYRTSEHGSSCLLRRVVK
jgi:hypothetical protein